jgi:hypothetical protein
MSWVVETTSTEISAEAQIRIKSLELSIEFCKNTDTQTKRMIDVARTIAEYITGE